MCHETAVSTVVVVDPFQKRYLSAFGGTSIDAATRAIVSRVMKPALQLQFNMQGKKGRKVAFKGANLCTVVIGTYN